MAAKVSFETVRKLGLQLPDLEEGIGYGKPALKVRGKMFACLPSHKSAEPGSLVVRTDFERRAEMLAGDPDVYYITDHYKDYPAVLILMARITPDMLRIYLAWHTASFFGKKPGGRNGKRPRGRDRKPSSSEAVAEAFTGSGVAQAILLRARSTAAAPRYDAREPCSRRVTKRTP
jgi:hypothetical protein